MSCDDISSPNSYSSSYRFRFLVTDYIGSTTFHVIEEVANQMTLTPFKNKQISNHLSSHACIQNESKSYPRLIYEVVPLSFTRVIRL
jgi:hypothetical protein